MLKSKKNLESIESFFALIWETWESRYSLSASRTSKLVLVPNSNSILTPSSAILLASTCFWEDSIFERDDVYWANAFLIWLFNFLLDSTK